MPRRHRPAPPLTSTSHEPPVTPSEGEHMSTTPSERKAPRGVFRRFESKFPRGLVIRLVAYLFVGHLFAFFVYLLFVLGGQNQ